ncbi:hypothetical protein MBLNU459_g4422t2 [Dothideomycetes sp. NU459]
MDTYVVRYLKLAGVPYSECIQPPILPRPDLAALGINYRRIPVVTIGKHAYCDTRLILKVLQEKFPLNNVQRDPTDIGVELLFQTQNINTGMFGRAASLIPFERSKLASHPAFLADRSDMMGAKFDPQTFVKGRPESWAHIRTAFELVEKTFLKDERDWISGGEGPTATDIEAVFLFHWLIADPAMYGRHVPDFVSEKVFPRTHAWVQRFKRAVTDATAQAPKTKTLDGNTAVQKILNASEGALSNEVDANDPLGFKPGQLVEVFPIDNGFSRRDRGELVALSINEACIRNMKGVYIHIPRWNFRIQKAADQDGEAEKAKKETAQGDAGTMRLIYHTMSPFARKVYMYARELGLDGQISLQSVHVAPIHYPGWSDNNLDVAVYNPLAKLPTLVVESGDGIYDSKMICDYLEARAQAKTGSADVKPNWRLKTLQACADGILDAQVQIVYEKKIRAENKVRFEPWIVGQQEKIVRALDRLELEAGRGTLTKPVEGVPASAAEVAVAAAMGLMDIVRFSWRETRPKLTQWFKHWEQRESFKKTRPDLDWKMGQKADMGFANEALAGRKQKL